MGNSGGKNAFRDFGKDTESEEENFPNSKKEEVEEIDPFVENLLKKSLTLVDDQDVLSSFPIEVLLRILSFCEELNSRYYALLQKNSLVWKDHYIEYNGSNFFGSDSSSQRNWKRLCIQQYWYFHKGFGIQSQKGLHVTLNPTIIITGTNQKNVNDLLAFITDLYIGLPDQYTVRFETLLIPPKATEREISSSLSPYVSMAKSIAGIVLVVDSTENDLRYSCSASILNNIFSMFPHLPYEESQVLVLAHNQDHPGAQSVRQIAQQLNLVNKIGRSWFIQKSYLGDEKGRKCIVEGYSWLMRLYLPEDKLPKLSGGSLFTSNL